MSTTRPVLLVGRGTITLSDNSPSERPFDTQISAPTKRSPKAKRVSVGAATSSKAKFNEKSQSKGFQQSAASSCGKLNADVFSDLIPKKPYCADNLDHGLQIRKKSVALQRRHLQLNGPASFQWMVHDIDRPGAYYAHDDANLPQPNVIMINPANNHAHAAYLMKTPVARHNLARLEPLRFYAAVERGIVRRLESDPYYSGLIAKNPISDHWRVEWRREDPYSLGELEGHLFERDMRPDPAKERAFGAGRNVTVFDELRSIAYREVRGYKSRGADYGDWLTRCVELALGLNRQFPVAMNIAECRAIAKSVAKWTWTHFSAEKFSARQSYLGKRGMAVRWAGHEAESTTEPWKAIGISRRTYYRRKKEGTL
nr:replication initiation protein [Filomicrobium sp.]